MKRPNITPGPWIYKATAGNHDFAVYPESTGKDVALVRDFNEANAQAIAALPDLLAALENALEQTETHTEGMTEKEFNQSGWEPIWNQLRDALTKAGYTF